MANFQEILNACERKIEYNWEPQFIKYLESLTQSKQNNSIITKINTDENCLLGLYTSVSRYAETGYDLRYKGQSIAEFEKGVVNYTSSKDSEYFGSSLNLQGLSLLEVLNQISDLKEIKPLKSKEHIFESRILKYLNSNKKKYLKQIKPVTVNELFFQMPTFFKASKHGEEEYKPKGGGIDILARLKCRNASPKTENCFCIMELKDSLSHKENPEEIIKQAIAYSCCIQHLIRSECGQKWYDFFRGEEGSKQVPKTLTLYACVVVPFGERFQKSSIPDNYKIEDELYYSNGDKLRLRYLYLEMNDNLTEIMSEPVTNLELKTN